MSFKKEVVAKYCELHNNKYSCIAVQLKISDSYANRIVNQKRQPDNKIAIEMARQLILGNKLAIKSERDR